MVRHFSDKWEPDRFGGTDNLSLFIILRGTKYFFSEQTVGF
ncbi:hypothetical protein D922_01509 [Enterococcus faecalis 06-MB-DW-09]|nr:hypothetical protein D922_01509 [Enterococcus faecalis 06-MB-DW-09]